MHSTSDHTDALSRWLGMEAPRYTSYPTAHHFSAEVTAEEHAAWLGALAEEAAVSLYVHIPFCQQMCWFCGCHTKMTKRYEPVTEYLVHLHKEIALLSSLAGTRGKAAGLHFGGGSPTMLELPDLAAIVHALTARFPLDEAAEVAIEIDPRTVSPEKIAGYAALGFNRASIGVQDFDPQVQQAIGRTQPYAMVAGVVEQLRRHGMERFNLDLIYGLPYQTRATVTDTIRQAISLAPARMSLFSYAHVPSIKKHQRLIPVEALPSDEEKLALYSAARTLLEEAGYIAVGIDHFARPEDSMAQALKTRTLRRNFQGYVTDATEALIGVGVSAISQLPQGYIQNSSHARPWREALDAHRLPTVRGWRMQGEDPVRKAVIDALMCYLEADLAEIVGAFGCTPSQFAAELEELKGMEALGIVTVEGAQIRVADTYRMAARIVASVFDQYRHTPAGRYSRVA